MSETNNGDLVIEMLGQVLESQEALGEKLDEILERLYELGLPTGSGFEIQEN